MLSFLKSWKLVTIIVLLLGILGGSWYHQWSVGSYQDRLESLEQKNAELRVDLERKRYGVDTLRDQIEKQNEKIEEWKEKGQLLKEDFQEKVELLQEERDLMESRLEELKGQLSEDASCEESMEWMIDKSDEELE